jgi:RNA polymerase sigma-70 factor (family 1)
MRYYTDNELLIDEVREGKAEAYEYVFKTFYPRLRNYASHFVADVDDTEDILQDCFVRLWERRQTLTYVSLQALLFTMVRNGCLNYLKHQAIVNGYQVDHLAHVAGEERLYNYDMLNSTDTELLYDELQRQIDRVMERLSPRTRQIFIMSRTEGMKNREIAQQLGISVKIVERHIGKALSLFRKNISQSPASVVGLALLQWLAS